MYMNNKMRYEIYPDNLKIINSFLIEDEIEMKKILIDIFESYPQYKSNRSIQSFINEWKTHNFFYNLHILTSRTKDCDFEVKQYWYLKIFYSIFGGFK